MISLDVMPGFSEVVHYDDPGIGLYIRHSRLSAYPNYRAECHWHDDLEFIYVVEGQMRYSVDGQTVFLCEGDSLFVNARHLHYGYDWEKRECVFIVALVHPDLLTASRRLYDSFLAPFLQNPAVPFIRIPAAEGGGGAANTLKEVWRLKSEHPPGYQITAANLLSSLTVSLLPAGPQAEEPDARQDQKLLAQKKMVAYIAQNYAQEITLEDISGSASVSKSTVCRLFREYAHQTPFEYLNGYRLRVAQRFLIETEKSVTEIATLCGFSNVSYFTKVFRGSYGISPGRYRRRLRESPPPSAGGGENQRG